MVPNDKTISARRRVLGWLSGGALGLLCACPQTPESVPLGTGGLGLQLKVGTEVSVREITYQLSQSDGSFARSGSFGVDASGDIATGFIGSLAPARGYQMQLDAQAMLHSSGASTHCSGTASFGIEKGETTVVAVRMRCDGVRMTQASPGNQCPSIASLRALPAEAPVGRSVAIQADATDPDGKTAVLSYMWSAGSGRVATPFMAASDYQCSQPGIVELTISISDGDPLCTEQATLYVSCRAAGDAPGTAGNPVGSAAIGNAGRVAPNQGTAGIGAGRGAVPLAGQWASPAGAGSGALAAEAGRLATSASAGRVSNIWPPPEPAQMGATPPPRAGSTALPGAGGSSAPPPSASVAGSGGNASGAQPDAGTPTMDPGQPPGRRRDDDGSGERPRRREGQAGSWSPPPPQGGTVSVPPQPMDAGSPEVPPPPPSERATGGSGGMPAELPPVEVPPVAGGAPTAPQDPAPPTGGAADGGVPELPQDPGTTPDPEQAGSAAPEPEQAGSEAAGGSGGAEAGSGGAPSASFVRDSSKHAA